MNNPLDPTLRELNDCGCCAGTDRQTPAAIVNRPGLPAVRFRTGVHSQFKATLLAALSSQTRPSLQGLRTRENDDLTIALLDALACTADVLTFYSERILNEAYLRTATERRSVLELARAVGYELKPGVSASTWLAFTVEDAPGAPGEAVIPKGTKVQSVPGPGERPQVYETSADFRARAAWNELRPRMRKAPPATPQPTANTVYLAGTTTNLKVGDVLVISDGSTTQARRITAVEPDRKRDHTKVDLENMATSSKAAAPTAPGPVIETADPGIGNVTKGTGVNMDLFWSSEPKSYEEMQVYAQVSHINLWKIASYQNRPTFAILARDRVGIFALRTRVGFFGHNAPKWKSLQTKVEIVDIADPTKIVSYQSNVYPKDWDSKATKIYQDSQGDLYSAAHVYLERVVPEVQAGGWVAFETNGTLTPFSVETVIEESRADYGLSAKCTGLRLQKVITNALDFPTRATTAYVASEPLAYLGDPIEDNLTKEMKELPLERTDYDLKPGQVVMLTGENDDEPGGIESEVLVLFDVQYRDGTTHLILRDGLLRNYKRATVRLNANVVPATHGEMVMEVLGSGDAAQPFQRFTLKQRPLTYAFPPGGSRLESSLEIWVGEVKWREVQAFFGSGPKDRVYVVRRADDGTTAVQFGDGLQGARLPTGHENVLAVYRRGIGLEGLVKEGQISLLLTLPLGVKAVTNPLMPSGAADPQSLAEARSHAPRGVLTLDRIVSLQDYEDFALDYPGVAKAHAAWTRSGLTRGVLLTLLGPDGTVVGDTGQPAVPLRDALSRQGNPHVPIRIVSRLPSWFAVAGTVKVDADRVPSQVEVKVKEALRTAFSFAAREFGQGVALSEVIAVIQNVPGVAFIDVTGFEKKEAVSDEIKITPGDGYVTAHKPADGEEALQAEAAELLILDEASLYRLEVKSL